MFGVEVYDRISIDGPPLLGHNVHARVADVGVTAVFKVSLMLEVEVNKEAAGIIVANESLRFLQASTWGFWNHIYKGRALGASRALIKSLCCKR